MIVRIDYPEPSVRLDLWGGTSGAFAGLDQFNRIIDQRWQNNTTSTPADIDRYQYGYDQDSNRLYKANVVGTPIVTAGLDEYYTYDPLNRLTEMQRGVLNGTKTGIVGTPAVEQDWTLDPTGNWSEFVTKASGTTDLNQTRTSNKVNEITNISESTGPTWVVPAYDAAGNTTTMPQVADPTQNFTALYDAWNRMVSISNASGTVATYAYDGRNRRIVKTTATETRHFYFTNAWQDVEERIGTSTSMDRQYVWGIRYVDELVCRDDATPQRLYGCQDASYNLTAITNASGDVQERYIFDPYGDRTIMNALWSTIGSSGYDWIIGHQGLSHDRESGLIHGRWRYLSPAMGKWTQREFLQYIDGPNFYQYILSNPGYYVDPTGMAAATLIAGAGASAATSGAGLGTAVGAASAGAIAGVVVVGAGAGIGAGYLINKYTPVDDWAGIGLYKLFWPTPVPPPPVHSRPPRPRTTSTGTPPQTGGSTQTQTQTQTGGGGGGKKTGSDDKCPQPKKCKPCVPPVGTPMAREDMTGKPHYDKGTKKYIPTPHSHVYTVNQTPYPECRCKLNAVPDQQGGIVGGVGVYPPVVQPSGGGPE